MMAPIIRDGKARPMVLTIQDVLEKSLSQIFNQKIRLNGSGRTDSGVHALGQVANFKTESTLETNPLLKGTNSRPSSRYLDKEHRGSFRRFSCSV